MSKDASSSQLRQAMPKKVIRMCYIVRAPSVVCSFMSRILLIYAKRIFADEYLSSDYILDGCVVFVKRYFCATPVCLL